ncbi:MAG: zinc/manganese transport system ATP-binding protein [Microbacteriaceae bacterium]|jgi:zinc/manganese transport system ATP-binding protein|nr:zinc/manganese transport system ATP-binding protein [Microbacteriaceae bacterium]
MTRAGVSSATGPASRPEPLEMKPAPSEGPVVLRLANANLGFGQRTLWNDLNLNVHAGEFVAVLGPNGSGKTSLLKTILGQQQLDSGSISFDGHPVRRGDRRIGYIPQQRIIPQGTPMRARDMIALGVNGHRWGLPISRREDRRRVDELIDAVGARRYATVPVGTLSGGEQQRLRVGQALAGDPLLLLCDEPLLSLDLQHQRAVSELIDRRRREHDSAVIFVTHDVNPVLGMVDRVLYLAGGQFREGTPDEVLRSDVLTDLYGTPVDVIRSGGRIVVVGIPDSETHQHHIEAHQHAGEPHHKVAEAVPGSESKA